MHGSFYHVGGNGGTTLRGISAMHIMYSQINCTPEYIQLSTVPTPRPTPASVSVPLTPQSIPTLDPANF